MWMYLRLHIHICNSRNASKSTFSSSANASKCIFSNCIPSFPSKTNTRHSRQHIFTHTAFHILHTAPTDCNTQFHTYPIFTTILVHTQISAYLNTQQISAILHPHNKNVYFALTHTQLLGLNFLLHVCCYFEKKENLILLYGTTFHK